MIVLRDGLRKFLYSRRTQLHNICHSTDGILGRSSICKEGKTISRVIVYFNSNKTLFLIWWKQSNVINQTPGSWLTPGNGAILGTQYSQMLAAWLLSYSCGQISLGKQKFMLLNPWITFIPANRATLFMIPLGNDRSYWGRKLTGIQKKTSISILSTCFLKSSTLDVTLWWVFIWNTNNSLPIQRGLSTYFFPGLPYHQYFNHFACKSLNLEPNH